MEASPRVHNASMICSSSFVSFGRVIYRGLLLCSSVNLLHPFVLSIQKYGDMKLFLALGLRLAGFGEKSGSRRRCVCRHQGWPIVKLNAHRYLFALVESRFVHGKRKNSHAVESCLGGNL